MTRAVEGVPAAISSWLKVVGGGAAGTQAYADECEAGGFAPDAVYAAYTDLAFDGEA